MPYLVKEKRIDEYKIGQRYWQCRWSPRVPNTTGASQVSERVGLSKNEYRNEKINQTE